MTWHETECYLKTIKFAHDNQHAMDKNEFRQNNLELCVTQHAQMHRASEAHVIY